jgi:hypothetical protein
MIGKYIYEIQAHLESAVHRRVVCCQHSMYIQLMELYQQQHLSDYVFRQQDDINK